MFPKYELRSTSVSVFPLSPHRKYPARFHKQVEIGLVTNGVLNLTIAERQYRLEKNDLYIAFPNLVHGIIPSSAEGIVIIADPALFPLYQEKLNHLQPENAVLQLGEENGILQEIFLRLEYFFNLADNSRYEPVFLGYIGALLGEILLKQDLKERSSDSDLLQSIMMYLHRHYTEDVSLEGLSKAVGYSKWYVSKIISATFCCNFRSLVNSFRISQAQSLLLSSKKSVSDIAFACGFGNQSSFNRIFLSAVGVTPSAFRRMGGTIDEPQIFYR